MPNVRVRHVVVLTATVLTLVAVITSVAMMQGRNAAASAGTLPGYYQQQHALVTRLALLASRNAKATTKRAAAVSSNGDLNDDDDEGLTPDQFAAAERAAPGGFIDPSAVIAGQKQANGTASVGAPFSWQELGPRTLTNGNYFPEPVSGRLLSVAIDPKDSRTIYVGSAQGGIWKTTDGGNHWKPLSDFEPSLAINTIVIDAKNPNIIFAGTGEDNLSCDSYQGLGILRSTDAGAHWTVLGESLFAGTGIGNILLDPRYEGNASHEHLIIGAGFAGRSNSSTESCDNSLPAGQNPPYGVFTSNNGGQSFTETLSVGSAADFPFELGTSDMVMSSTKPERS